MAGWHRLTAYLTGRRNLIASGLALVAAGLALLDRVGPGGVVLVVGFYALGVAATRRDPLVDRYGFNPKAIERALQRQIADASGRVPPEVIVRLQRIEAIARTEVLPRLDCLPPGSVELYLVERTARDYLPTAIDHYLRLPASYSPAGRAGTGATPLKVLIDELNLVEAEMRRIAALVQRTDMDRLLAHRRFLRDRLGGADLSG